MNSQIEKTIRKCAKIIHADPKMLKRIFMRGDVHQKKRDLISMRAIIFAKKNIKPGTPYDEQQTIMEKFEKSENLKDVRWPEFKIKNKGIGQPIEEGSTQKGSLPESIMPDESKSSVVSHNKQGSTSHEVESK